jgi:hypothetical protein
LASGPDSELSSGACSSFLRRCDVRWTEKVFTLTLLACGLALPAAAQPPFDRGAAPPPQTMRPDFQLRSNTDGRGDLHESAMARPELPAAARPAPERLTHKESPLPLRNDVALRARPGDEGDNASTSQPSAPQTSQSSQPARDDRMGRAQPAPKIPLKTQISLRIEGEEGPDAVAPQSGQPGARADKAAPRQSKDQLKAFARHTGISLPFNNEATDDVEDKTE